jgi:hypothetical protein
MVITGASRIPAAGVDKGDGYQEAFNRKRTSC